MSQKLNSKEKVKAIRMNKLHFKHTILQKILCITVGITLCITNSTFLCTPAFAEARKTDVIVNATMREKGLKATDCPDIVADIALLQNSAGEVLYSRNADKKAKIASLTKIVTAGCALKNLQLTDKVTVSASAASIGGSSASLISGDEMTFLDALYAMMLPSGNDAAYAVAETAGEKIQGSGNSVDKFITAMNEYATDLGCTKSLFTNPHGLDADEFESDAHSTANDLIKVINNVIQNDTMREIVKTKSKTISITRGGNATNITLNSTDELLDVFDGASGIKTGTTDLAGYCFAGAFERDSDRIYTIVLNSESEGTRFQDTTNLATWYYDGKIDYKLVNVNNNDGILCEVPHADFIDKCVPATISNVDETIKIFKYKGNISQKFDIEPVSGDIKRGDVVGKVSFYQNNTVVCEVDLIAETSVSRGGILDTFYLNWHKFISIFTHEQTIADSHIYNETPLVLK